jgi:hypothetical protein
VSHQVEVQKPQHERNQGDEMISDKLSMQASPGEARLHDWTTYSDSAKHSELPSGGNS